MEASTRRVTLTGLFMLAGSAGGALVSAAHLLAAAMGAVAGLAAALIVHAFPRDRDYPGTNFWTD